MLQHNVIQIDSPKVYTSLPFFNRTFRGIKMVTKKMWKSIQNIFHFFPRGMLVYSPVSKNFVQKHRFFRRNSLGYFLFLTSYISCLPFHIIYRIHFVQMSLPFRAIHYVGLILTICADTLTAIFAYAWFGPGQRIIVMFNSVSGYQKKTFGTEFEIILIQNYCNRFVLYI